LVANIKTVLGEAGERSHKKDPGRKGSKKRHKAKRKGRVRREEGGGGERVYESDSEEEWGAVVAPALRSGRKLEQQEKRAPTTRRRSKRSEGASGKKSDDSGGRVEEETTPIEDSGRVEELGEEQDLGEGGQRLRRPGSTPSEQEDRSEEDEEWDSEEETEWEENLTFHEDSLSVFRGMVNGVPVWVTTDTGSMTQLIQSSYATRLKFERRPISKEKRFHINSPGGGRDEIDEYVILPVEIRLKRELKPEEGYDDCQSVEEVRTIKMKFGLCEHLPVPILWGGNQMRKLDLLDHHNSRVLSLRKWGDRFITKSTSWMAATLEMKQELEGKVRKAYQSFLPSKDRLANMVLGGRTTINMPAILYPGRDNVVRVARKNARIDEGYNEVLVNNPEAFQQAYGDWIVPMECVTNGEAFVIVRNNTTRPIRLGPGDLELTVRPTVALPRVWAPRDALKDASRESLDEIEESEDNLDESDATGADTPQLGGRTHNPYNGGSKSLAMAVLAERETLEERQECRESPDSFLTWNLNGLALRMKRGELQERFYDLVGENRPDLISLQEIKLECEPGEPGVAKRDCEGGRQWEAFMKPLRESYDAYLSLSAEKYGGQAVLVRRSLGTPVVSYNMGGERGHHESGRFVKLEFPALIVRSVYVPFNGSGKIPHHQRRKEWDRRLREELAPTEGGGKARLLLGDLNVANRDSDLSDDPKFWSGQGSQEVPVGDRGFGGTTPNERSRFKGTMTASRMSDTFTTPLDTDSHAQWTFRGMGKYQGKGMKVDYVMADDEIVLSGGVEHSRILCGLFSRDGFMGSDHAPLMCTLHPRWQKKRANLLAHYAAGEERGEPALVSEMFKNTAAVGTLPKVMAVHVPADDKQHKGLSVNRPDAFPERLWAYVEPQQRLGVAERYARYKSRVYLDECLEAILTKLDIQPREEFHTPEWFEPWEGEPALQENFLRAQALASPHIYFHPNPDEIAMAKDVVADVVTTNEKPFKCRPRKFSVVQQAFLQAKTSIMLRMSQLEGTNSEWCHGLVLVAYEDRIQAFMQRHGEKAMSAMFEKEHEAEVATFFRLCVDLRMLNARTVPDRFPLPRIDDLLESVPRSCGRYSISDIADAFFKCELNKADRHKTAFRTHDRHLQFAVLPQGFINSPSVFCRLIARTFEGMRRERFSAYIDDVLNHSEDFQTHMDTQQELYDRLGNAGLTLKLSKTHLNYERVKFLGHILTKGGRLPDPEAVEAIQEWRDPTTTKEVRSFLGSTLYYREYIHGYSDMAMPLYDLIKKGVVVSSVWRDDFHGVACQRIKDALTSKPVLMQVDNTKPFRLKVDACRVGRGIGCILEQQNSEGKWQPVSYYSCSLSKEERNYSATELECKALHDCILHYAVYLKYIPHFEVFSDHNALRYMVSSDNSTTNGRLMRYLLALQEYNFAIYYRRGTENCDADAVSRLTRTSDQPIYLTEEDLSKENGVVSKSLLQRARALDRRNERLEKVAQKTLNRLAKQDLQEMSLLNDHILAEGVENLESESGRARFFENLRALGLKCSRGTLDATLESMREDAGGAMATDDEAAEEHQLTMIAAMACTVADNRGFCPSEQEEEGSRLCMPVALADSKAGEDQGKEEDLICGACSVGEDSDSDQSVDCEETDLGDGEYEKDREATFGPSDSGAVYSRQEVPKLLANLVSDVQRGFMAEDQGILDHSPYTPKKAFALPDHQSLLKMRQDTLARVETLPREVLATMSYSMRKRKKPKYLENEEEGKPQPNERDFKGTLMSSPVNAKLVAARKYGHGRLVVKESMIPGDTGWGLFAAKAIKEKSDFCSYEGKEVPLEHLLMGYGNKDYVIQAIKNHKTMEFICMDSPEEASCYGRYAQDPIDEDLVNTKILWVKGRMVLKATRNIAPGEEIYVHYGLDYWKDRLHYLDKESRSRIEPRIRRSVKGTKEYQKSVSFREESTIAVFSVEDPPERTLDGVREEGVVTLPPAADFETRMRDFEVQEGDETPEEEELTLNQTLLDELSIENVHECEELADSLQFLNGRKFEDEGRTYEIMQVRFDPDYERVIGFRRPMSGKTPHREDGSAFCVYGHEGLYELSERYLLLHPEERNEVKWPSNTIEWAKTQTEDPELEAIRQQIRDQDGVPVKKGKNKYALKGAEGSHGGLLVRVVNDLRKGTLEQTMVPKVLVRSTLQMHHEGYGHMGSNRMLETIRLRYFWTNMDRDITEHTGKCLNCKLRKSYQRKPKVPIMKYDDTSRPLDRVHVDLTGPLPLTKLKNRYVMVIKDYLTKYVWLIPLKTKTASEVAEAFVGEFVCQAGVPGRLVSDRGNEFVNQLLVNISKIMQINRISTTPYNPRADGFVENHNKTLKDQLFHFVDNLKQDDWDVYLPTAQLMYNTTVSLATGYTPMLLLTGREARMPSLNHLEGEERVLRSNVVNNAYILKMVETMRGYQDFALSQTEKNKERLNVRVRQPLEFVEYMEGQQFMRVRRPISKFKSADEKDAWKVSAKLLERYEGPYRIVRMINPVLYEAEIDGKLVRVHAVNMKPF
jgi:exodeoxyribonuclease III